MGGAKGGLGGRGLVWYINLVRRVFPVQSAQRRRACCLCCRLGHGTCRRLTVPLSLCAQPPSCLGQRLPGRVFFPSYLLLRFLRVLCPRPLAAEGGRPPSPRPFSPRSWPGARGAFSWMRPRSPGREAARGKRCLRGFTAAWDSDPLFPRGRRGSAAAPGRHGREVPTRADGREGLAGPVLHPRLAPGQPR